MHQFEGLNANGKTGREMNKRNRNNLIVGFFALGGNFSSMVGVGLNNWWAEENILVKS